MAGACPAPAPDDPLVQSLMGVVDCNVRELVHASYGSLFQAGGPISGGLTALLTIFVALIGYQLLLGRAELRVSDFVLNAVKVGAVIALATQWETYQTAVYDLLFHGPQELATLIAGRGEVDGAHLQGGVFAELQSAFDTLSQYGANYGAHASASASPMMGGPGLGALLLNASAAILLLSTLGVLLAAKIVLGLLLGVGPIFIALLLFESTRGVFEGWLRACLAFGFVPLSITVILGLALRLLEPSLDQLGALQAQRVYALDPAASVMTLILVIAGVSAGAVVAGAMIALSLKLPRARPRTTARESVAPRPARTLAPTEAPSRAARVAAALTLDRRETGFQEAPAEGRRAISSLTPERGAAPAPEPVRLGQQSQYRRASGPRPLRPNARTAR